MMRNKQSFRDVLDDWSGPALAMLIVLGGLGFIVWSMLILSNKERPAPAPCSTYANYETKSVPARCIEYFNKGGDQQ